MYDVDTLRTPEMYRRSREIPARPGNAERPEEVRSGAKKPVRHENPEIA